MPQRCLATWGWCAAERLPSLPPRGSGWLGGTSRSGGATLWSKVCEARVVLNSLLCRRRQRRQGRQAAAAAA